MYGNASQNRIRAVILWGAVCALSWAALSLFFGGSAAHADDQPPSNPLSPITSLVSSTVTVVTDPVVQVIEPVVQDAEPVVQTVVEPVVKAVVQPVAKTAPAVVATAADTAAKVPVAGPVIKTVSTGVADAVQSSVTAPVTEILHQQPISSITDPVLGAIDQLPVIGDLGATDIVRSVVGAVDGTVADVVEGADTILPPVIGALGPTAPAGSSPTTPVISSDDATGAAALSTAGLLDAIPPQDAAVHPQSWVPFLADAQDSAVPYAGDAAVSPTSPITPGPLPDLGSAAAPASSSGSSGGGSAGSAAALNNALVLPTATRAGGFSAGDDALPSSPSTSFDVSPD
ncbi:hypothetical protein [uncultured Microbacterium sp.]|uniref:hypothetical protein n=1 Tax=uncultured Microbacterium sp. TaxID=191216 RepID=UPI002631E535|nr:hypothetical protein [uncultured Microbacterium sp.]